MNVRYEMIASLCLFLGDSKATGWKGNNITKAEISNKKGKYHSYICLFVSDLSIHLAR